MQSGKERKQLSKTKASAETEQDVTAAVRDGQQRKARRSVGIRETGVKRQGRRDLARIEQRESKRTRRRQRRLQRSGQPFTANRVLFLSFFVPFIIMAVAFAAQGMWPVRDTTPLTIDLYHQYAPFLQEFREKLLNFDSFFYSWHGGLGMNFYALLAYYLASPLNLLMVFFPPNFLSEAVTVLTLLKIGLMGLTFSYMLREVFTPFGQRTIAAKEAENVRYASETGTDWVQILFSTAFALSGFMLAYSWDIMWLDSIVMLPLVITGMYRLIKNGRFVLYTISLAAAIIFNYYIALFICIFTAFYFFVLYISVTPDIDRAVLNRGRYFFRRLFQFAASSVLAGLLSAFIALPTALALQVTSATGDSFPSTWRFDFDFFEFIARHLIDMEPNIRSGLPNIYVGLLVFILLPVYAMAKHIRLSEKLAHLAMLAFLYISFNSNVLNFIWHGMHYPNQLPYRFAFVYSFLVLIIMYRAMSALRDMQASQIAMGAIFGIIYVVMAERFLPEEVDHETAMLSVLFLILLLACLSLLRDKRRNFRFMIHALTFVMIAEILINTIVTITTIHINESYTRRSSFNNDFDDVRAELAYIAGEEGENAFYRTELIQQKTTNSPALYGYKGFTVFSSTSYETTAKLMRRLGYHGNNINSYKYTSSTAVLNSIFGFEYLINKDEPIRDPLLEEVDGPTDLYSYRNPYALGLGYMVSADILDWNSSAGTVFQIQNNFLEQAIGSDDVFIPLDLATESAINMNDDSGSARSGYSYVPVNTDESAEITLLVSNTENSHVYLHIDTSWSIDVYATAESQQENEDIDNISFDDRRGINRPELFDLGYIEEGETVRVKINIEANEGGRFRVAAAGLQEDVYVETMTQLAEGNLEITDYTSRRVDGTVEAEEAGYLFLSIPYDGSWVATVDGAEAEIIPIADSLSAIQLEAGVHSIRLAYTPPGFWIGLMITLFGVLLLLIALLIWRSLDGKRSEQEKQARIALQQRREMDALYRTGREQDANWQYESEPAGIRSAAIRQPDSVEAVAPGDAKASERNGDNTVRTPGTVERTETKEPAPLAETKPAKTHVEAENANLAENAADGYDSVFPPIDEGETEEESDTESKTE